MITRPEDNTVPAVGAIPNDLGTTFTVWAPKESVVSLHLLDQGARPQLVQLNVDSHGYWSTFCPEVRSGARYRYQLSSGQEYADPASRAQPDGHLGPSQVADLHHYAWQDANYRPRPLGEQVISEVHIGTFTSGGTFDDAIAELDGLAAVGISAVEVMPVAEFPGTRNWGYDGVFPFAVQHSYGGVAGLQSFVDACHQRGLAVILDVVYNHIGPEGSVFDAFGPYFTDRYRTPWGEAINFDGPGSDHVRGFFLQNARQWFEDFHIDGLRLDAVHEIIDRTATPFLVDLSRIGHSVSQVSEKDRWLIAESPDNDPRLVLAETNNGIGLQAVWNDDFHHALHVAVTGERSGYYADYAGTNDLAIAIADGFVFQGRFSSFRDRNHGAVPRGVRSDQFINFAQNHDQIGNRPNGDRLITMVSPEVVQLVAATLLLSPGVPLLFMGEEYGETAPFPYFVDHHDSGLLQAVREGRAAEFASIADAGQLYDPGDAKTYEAAKLNRSNIGSTPHRAYSSLYAALIRARRQNAALSNSPLSYTATKVDDGLVTIQRSHPTQVAVCLLNFSDRDRCMDLPSAKASADWHHLVSSRSFSSGDSSVIDGVDRAGTITVEPWGFTVYQRSTEETQ